MRLKDVLKLYYQEQFNLIIRLENVLKTSLQDVLNNVMKASWKRLEDVLKTFSQDVLARLLEDILKTLWKRPEDVLQTDDQDEHIGLDQDVFWRRRQKTSFSRRMFAVKDTYREKKNKTPVLTRSAVCIFGSWYIKSTFYKRFLNWNKIFKKIN